MQNLAIVSVRDTKTIKIWIFLKEISKAYIMTRQNYNQEECPNCIQGSFVISQVIEEDFIKEKEFQ